MASQFATFLRWLLEKVDDSVDQPTKAVPEEPLSYAAVEPVLRAAPLTPEPPPGAGTAADPGQGPEVEAAAVAAPPENLPADAIAALAAPDSAVEPFAPLADAAVQPQVELEPADPVTAQHPEVESAPVLEPSVATKDAASVEPPAAPQPMPAPRPVFRQFPQFTTVRLPDDYARAMLPRQLATANNFKRSPLNTVAPQAMPPGSLPQLGPDGAYRRAQAASAQVPPAMQKWPAPIPTYNTFP